MRSLAFVRKHPQTFRWLCRLALTFAAVMALSSLVHVVNPYETYMGERLTAMQKVDPQCAFKVLRQASREKDNHWWQPDHWTETVYRLPPDCEALLRSYPPYAHLTTVIHP